MEKEHIADRAARHMRPYLIFALALCFPAFLITYGFMLVDALKTWPWWASLIALLSHVAVGLGASSLHDRQKERRN